MPDAQPLLLGEFTRTLDERYRLAIPEELLGPLDLSGGECVLAKERKGCVSVWNPEVWQAKVNVRVELAKQKMAAGLLENEIARVQLLGRLLSTRHERTPVTDRGRLVIPKGFRQFLGVLPETTDDERAPKGRPVMVIGAAVCIEIWNPVAWLKYLEGRMPKFRRLVERLS
jgi:MraZ protein